MSRLRSLLGRLVGSPRALGVAAVVAVLVVAALLDVPGRLSRLAPAEPAARSTATAPATPTAAPASEEPGRLSNLTNADNRDLDRCTPGSDALADCGPAPALGEGTWLNSPDGQAVTLESLRGSVVVVDFFSGSCINCRRAARYLNAWQSHYFSSGLRVVGVHSPELEFEKDDRQLARTLRDLAISFPVLQDVGFATLTDYRSQVLPSTYLVDAAGTVRAISFGEAGATRTESLIRDLLVERGGAGSTELPDPIGQLDDGEDVEPGTTPQINLGESRGRRFDSESDSVVGDDTRFRLPASQPEGTFSFGGRWTVGAESSKPVDTAVARVAYRGRAAYQLVAGTGTLTVTTSSGLTRSVRVRGGPRLRQIHVGAGFGPETLTVRYEGDLQVYAFSFG